MTKHKDAPEQTLHGDEARLWNAGYGVGFRDGRVTAVRVMAKSMFVLDNNMTKTLEELIRQIEERR
jgi:hypothetical protein